MEITPEIKQRLELLNEKYGALGQDLLSYLDGLLYADVTTYWDYIELETLLSLQKPKTKFPDEMVFIMYHQITELYFKLALLEFEQIGNKENIDAKFFVERVTRINRYFEALIKSFEIMIQGMDRDQFLKFRMSLLPASGFQSAQYRDIEIFSTDFVNLVDKDQRANFKASDSIASMFEHIYWKAGATEVGTGKKTLTLVQFEEKYRDSFIALGEKCRDKNLWQSYLRLSEADQAKPEVKEALRTNDTNVNVNWPLAHYKSAVRYLAKDTSDIAATGGTNWQKYLPPRFQKRIFYPELWSNEEVENWGKAWVEEALKR
ncbi:MAG: tryptophan 2,3-dioxygenase [Flavobacteriales bacterium]|nr:tryptophan 2,3-dioxygenase [Flavobacteriales bacterium]